MSTYTISTVEELAAIAPLDSDGDGGYVYVISSGDLHITESIEIPGLIIDVGSVSCDKSLTVRGDMLINNGSVSVTGDFKARWAVVGPGAISIGGNLEITEDLYSYSSVSVGGNMSCGYFNNQDDPISVGGELLMQGGFYGGPTNVGGNLASPKDVVLQGPLTVGKNINVGGYLIANDGGIAAGNNINVAGYVVCDGPISAG